LNGGNAEAAGGVDEALFDAVAPYTCSKRSITVGNLLCRKTMAR
jgi:hypothetical protein